MHPIPHTVCLPARFSALPQLLAALAPGATGQSADVATLLRAQTAVEELFANSVHHAYGGESDQPVWLEVQSKAGTLHLVYADAGPPYDPLADLDSTPPVIDDHGEASRVGGVGRRLVRGLADHARYRRHEARNEITLDFMPRG